MQLHIIYASETGTARDVAHFIQRDAGRYHTTATTTSVATLNPSSLVPSSSPTLYLWIVSTTGQGDMPRAFLPLWRFLLRKALPPTALSTHSYSVFALGDSGYRLFNAAGRKLDRRLPMLGASRAFPRGEGDDQHPHGLDGGLLPWLDALWEYVLSVSPLPPGTRVLSRSELGIPPPRYALSPAVVAEDDDQDPPSVSDPSAVAAAHGQALNLPPLSTGSLAEQTRLTAPSHFQNVLQIQLELDPSITPVSSSALYAPGDVINILPSNPEWMVEDVAALLGYDLDQVFHISANPEPNAYSEFPLAGLTVSTRTLLRDVIDLTASPRRYFWELARHYASDPREIERLEEFSSPEGVDDLYDYNYRDARWPLEVFQDFPSLRPPLSALLETLPLIVPRAYSISSAPSAASFSLAITMAVVEYETKIKSQPRYGMTSTLLASAPLGHTLPVFLSKGSIALPKDPVNTPMVMIGPGTGIAPFMSFLEYLHTHALIPPVPHLLFFGNRDASSDNLYGDLLSSYEASGLVTVIYAWSRVPDTPKTYVQHRMIEPDNASLIWDAVDARSGCIYICGSAKSMPSAVKDAITSIAVDRGVEDGAAYVKNLVRTRRLLEDTWM